MTPMLFLQPLDRRVKNSKKHYQFPPTAENCGSKVIASAWIDSPSTVLVTQERLGGLWVIMVQLN